MPTNLTPGFDLNATITVPNAGEARTALSVRTPFQAVADRLGEIVDGALLTLLDSRRELNVQSGGTRTNFDIDIGGIAAIMLRTGAGGRYTHSTAGGSAVVTEAHVSGGDLGAVAKAWYVYAYRSGGGSLTWEVSDTAPDATRTVKSTDSTRAYFGCFLTDSSGSPIPVRAVNGNYAYRLSAAGTAVRALSVVPATPPATSFTNIDLSPFLPPHARVARLYAAVTNADASNWARAQFRTDGETAYQVEVNCPPAAAQDGDATLEFELEVSASRIIEYRRDTSGSRANLSLALFVTGWKE